MWSEVVELFREFMGTGLILILYLISLVYLFVREKRQVVRILLIYVPLVLLLFYFNPLFADLVYGLAGAEVYYRILWLLPITIVIAYTCVQIYGELKGPVKSLWAIAAAVVIALSGSYIYSNPHFQKAQNMYHVPDAVVNICDTIVVPGREVMVVFPIELVQYVRQYTPLVCMPYGREMIVERWHYQNDLHDVMESEPIDLRQLAPLAKEARCHYVVLRKDSVVIGNLAAANWSFVKETDGYEIYRVLDNELIIPKIEEESNPYNFIP